MREELRRILAAKLVVNPDLVVLTGLGLGTEQLGAEAAAAADVGYVAVLAFPSQEQVWPASTGERYRRLLEGATGQVLLQAKAPESKQSAGMALRRRDAWLARHAHEAVVVWDGKDDRAGKLVRSLVVQLGEEQVWVVEPA